MKVIKECVLQSKQQSIFLFKESELSVVQSRLGVLVLSRKYFRLSKREQHYSIYCMTHATCVTAAQAITDPIKVQWKKNWIAAFLPFIIVSLPFTASRVLHDISSWKKKEIMATTGCTVWFLCQSSLHRRSLRSPNGFPGRTRSFFVSVCCVCIFYGFIVRKYFLFHFSFHSLSVFFAQRLHAIKTAVVEQQRESESNCERRRRCNCVSLFKNSWVTL